MKNSSKIMMHEGSPIGGVNIVPVIDLCLVLLVILLITSPMLEAPDLEINLPQAITTESKERNISISLTADGRMAYNNDLVQEEEMLTQLGRQLKSDPNILVILRVDKTVAYKDLTGLLAAVKQVGARRIAIGTEQKQ